MKQNKLKFWLVTVDMGYGHQRASYPLRKFAYQGLINANTYKGIPRKDKKIWDEQRRFYETVCRLKVLPVAGNIIFGLFDRFQRIPDFYPKRDLSGRSIQLISSYHLIRSKKFGEDLINRLKKKPNLPFVTTFFLTAFMAEIFNYPGEIYCVICDTDISRVWAGEFPSQGRIKYFVPCQRVVERLKLYGVPKSRIFLTGFPLPKENIGDKDSNIIKRDFKNRLINLDPCRIYLSQYQETLFKKLSLHFFPKNSDHPLTLTFAVGGAGVQREIGGKIIKGLRKEIMGNKIRVNLIAGVHRNVYLYFKKAVNDLKLKSFLGKNIRILYTPIKEEYFKKFNHWLRSTDILWTKPSELSFYSSLGLPIIIAPAIGSQEDFNRKYLIDLGAGIDQGDLKYINEWLFNWINSGRLAEAGAEGFLEAPRRGTHNIERILAKHIEQVKKVRTISLY